MADLPAVPPEAYEAAAEALFHANELWPSFTKGELAQSMGGPREARLRTAQVAVDAVWSLGVAEGRRQAAAEIRLSAETLPVALTRRRRTGGNLAISDDLEWAARIAEGNTDA